MSKKLPTRKELLDQWRDIEDQEEQDGYEDDPSKSHRLHHSKEKWFADTFNFLITMPEENHIWCGTWDLMEPLLETFYNYHKDERDDSPLRRLWRRISEEMRHCVQCITQHHQAREMYNTEYESSSISPLLDLLQSLDEERVSSHLKQINCKLMHENYDPFYENGEVISVMYEVLMFPHLLDDQSLFTEFEKFIEAIDNVHELALDGQQQFPGVYALFFFKRRVRMVGYRLAGSMGKLRGATDLEPLQPLIGNSIGLLETGVLPSAMKTSRPRTELDRVSVWLGIKTLLGFLEPVAFEEGILEHYPIFLDIVLNHISSDTVDFSHAVTCLRLLFEMLGCKLWLRSTLSPSVMRNTLLGQCFHTRNEKSHKDIFDLFQPFLQSLEALQDGEHEKQRRNFLYFLLHQVPVSNNFSVLTRQKARQIALLIVHRGYTMNPPCPPFECAHMWGPPLVLSLKDSSLHNSLRQPAFDLIEAILVSDAAVLISSALRCSPALNTGRSWGCALDNDNDDFVCVSSEVSEEKDRNSWRDFSAQSKIVSVDFADWMCIPMLWIDVLVDINPLVLPVSFSKAAFWARTRFSMVESEINPELEMPIRTWLSSCEISGSFGWKAPTGSNDGGDAKEQKNSVKVSTQMLSLVRAYNRLTEYFLTQAELGELRKQWVWEPQLGESLILSLIDSNHTVRQFGKFVLEHVSDTRGLAGGLKFLCYSKSSLSAVLLGLRHAVKLVHMDIVILKFQNLQHFFFVLRKLLDREELLASDTPVKPRDEASVGKVLVSGGGFLKQPAFAPLPTSEERTPIKIDVLILEKFCWLLSQSVWLSIRRCLMEGKAFLGYSTCQMTCVRLLEVLPAIFERLHPLVEKRASFSMPESVLEFSWLHDLMDWGKSTLKVVVVYWKKTVGFLLNSLKGSCNASAVSLIKKIEDLISHENLVMDELVEQVSRLSVSLSKEASEYVKLPFSSEGPSLKMKESALDLEPFPNEYDDDVQILDPITTVSRKNTCDLIVLSDDENEALPSEIKIAGASKEVPTQVDKVISYVDRTRKKDCEPDAPKHHLSKTFQQAVAANEFVFKSDSDKHSQKQLLASSAKSETVDTKNKKISAVKSLKPLVRDDLKNLFEGVFSTEKPDKADAVNESVSKSGSDKHSQKQLLASSAKSETVDTKNKKISAVKSLKLQVRDDMKNIFEGVFSTEKPDKASERVTRKTDDKLLKDIVSKAEDDPLESALNSVRHQPPTLTKPIIQAPKRQVIQLGSPFQNKSGGYLHRLAARTRRFKPPRLDEWYKPILEMDYFATVGPPTSSTDDSEAFGKLKEVPVCFQSPQEYIDIFRPLVLEEFKAQLQSSFLELPSLEDIYFGVISVLSVERIDAFHLIRFAHDDSDSTALKSFAENDLVLLTKEPPKNSSHDLHVVGKVERRERDNKRRLSILIIRFHFQNGNPRLHQARKGLLERSKWHACRIMSITPQLREFQALSAVNDIPLLPVILKPLNDGATSIACLKVDLKKLSQPLRQILKSSFNESQLQAISVAVSSDYRKKFELSLIQGPPGTGKTRTILAIASGLLALPLQRTDQANSLRDSSRTSNSSFPKISASAAIARAWQDAALAKQWNEDVQSSSKPTDACVRRRILICAQSNAAVDELVSRISSQGLHGSDGKIYKPYLVRVGNFRTVHPNSLPYFIDTLVDHRLVDETMMLNDAKDDSNAPSLATLRSNLEKLVDRIRFLEAKRANLSDGNPNMKKSLEDDTHTGDQMKEMSDAEVQMKLRQLYEQKKQIYKDISAAQAQERKTNNEIRGLKFKLRRSILREAEIVVATLSGCGGDLYGVCSESMSGHKFGSPSEHNLFDAVVIDEAAQALEPATLIPLQLLKSNGGKCIMVGDPKQLPATVLSNVASKFQFECSMFERLQKAGHPVLMLTKQYRMHPEICSFPSMHFYERKLLNGEMSSKSAPFHETEGLGPYVFNDIVDGRELRGKNSGSLSLYNEHEADAAVEVLKFLKTRYPSEFLGGRIGIITPYKCQLSLLRSRFASAFGSSIIDEMEFNTVDGFQGREVDILILSTVRAAEPNCVAPGINSSKIGFVADVRRMNVALTRARLSLWIMGNARTLQTNRNWAALVEDAKRRNLVRTIKMPYRSMFKSDKKKENFKSHSTHPPKFVEKVEDVRRHERVPERRERGSDGSKRQDGGSGFSSTKDEIGFRQSSGDRNDNRGKDFSKAAISNIDKRTSEEKKSVRESNKKKIKLDDSLPGKRKPQIEQMGRSAYRRERDGESKSREPKRPKMLSGDGVSLENRDNQERGSKDRDTNCSSTSDLLAQKKKQRKEVDAILSSGFIPSKKSETSAKVKHKK